MTPEHWQKVKKTFHSALARAPRERAAFLAEACRGDEPLRSEVESLIRSHEETGSFIDSPAYDAAAQLFADEHAGLSAGEAVAQYEIVSHLGSGGMGEVYLAEDHRLGRKVALKILPASFAADEDRLRRFEQEARAASALNHPNILTIYETGESGARHYIAAEHVEGETLRQRLARGRLGARESLDLFVQLASALSAAHAAGIVHRDIKPENIMLRSDGLAKLLDFGIAKLVRRATGSEGPTLPLVETGAGLVIGTSRYMSPEQARGLDVDARTDIWSLGVVLYESLAGAAPFDGETASDVIAAVLAREPAPLARRAGDVPEALEWIVVKALTKEREDRYQTARELLTDLRRLKQRLEVEAEIERAATPEDRQATPAERAAESQRTVETEAKRTGKAHTAHTTASARPLWGKIKQNRRSAALALAALLVGAGGIVWAAKFFGRGIATEPEAKLAYTASPVVLRATQITSSPGLDSNPSLSPDGNSIAYASDQNGSFEIYVKQLTPGGREIQLTSDGQQNLQPAWSPDGQRVAYYSRGRGSIWVMPALGGTPKQLTEFGARPAWSHDGSMIAFQSAAPPEPVGGQNALPPGTLWIISSQGGTPRQVTQQGNPPGGHGAPAWSPDGKRIVFDASDFVYSSLWSVSLEGGELKRISASDCNNAIYAPDGKDIYYTSNGLWKIHLSPVGDPVGGPVQVAGADATSVGHPTISADGKRIAYSVSTRVSNLWSVPLVPGSAAAGPPAPFTRDSSARNNLARFSPDGQKIAFSRWRAGMSADIWMADADGRNATQLTANPATDSQPSWFPEGDRIAFLSDRNSNHMALWSIALATGKEELLLDLGEGVEYATLSPDGKRVAFNSKRSGTINIWTSAVNGGEQKQLTFDNELMAFPSWSPDGKFLAFEIKRGNDNYLAVIPSEGGTPKQLVSDHGMSWSHSWSPDGEKIAFAGLRNGSWNIYWVSRDGKTQKRLTNYAKLNAYVRYPAWSPLGDKIVYEYVETTGNIWTVDLK